VGEAGEEELAGGVAEAAQVKAAQAAAVLEAGVQALDVGGAALVERAALGGARLVRESWPVLARVIARVERLTLITRASTWWQHSAQYLRRAGNASTSLAQDTSAGVRCQPIVLGSSP